MRLHLLRNIVTTTLALTAITATAAVRVQTAPNATPRELYAADQLRSATQGLPDNVTIILAPRNSPLFAHDDKLEQFWPGASEAFVIHRFNNRILIAGSDASGTLYGALELAQHIREAHAIPAAINFEDHPALKLRGTAVGMQKPEIIYDGAEYDYPYTQQNFPFFYDKAQWTRYLDMLVRNRMNTLYLWNGHPFTSLLKLPKYPEAQELTDAQLEQNIEMFRWITREADRRGIWVLQGFYNIHLSHAFARAHNIPFHLTTPTPEATAYTRYAISEFIRQYPNVGLMMTLGEALSPKLGDQWLTQAIIPGVKDGLAEIHSATQPPIVVRAHATDIDADMKAANPLYPNIDTMWKWNGESLTWTNIRGPILDRFKDMVANSNVTIANIHLLSNLEPFRWGDPDFIRQTVLNFQRIGIQGVHVYPLRYWDWPNTADNPPLQQIDRDWIWFDAWARYAWNPNRDAKTEHVFWAAQFAERFGARAGEHLLNAYELSGICSPELLPRIGVTEGNREVFSLGLTMPQLIDANRFSPAQTLWTGDAPDGERLYDYVAKEAAHQPHHGQTPIGIANSAADSSAKAVAEAEAAEPFITTNAAEYKRILNDTRCIHELMLFYQAKTHAAERVMLYGYDHDATHLTEAEQLLAQSVDHFRQLTGLTDTTYRDAASMHTSQRRLPVTGGPSTEHWRDLLPVYEKELTTFRSRLAQLNAPPSAQTQAPEQPLGQVPFTLTAGQGQTFTVAQGAALFMDEPLTITSITPEIESFNGIRLAHDAKGAVRFTLSQPAQVLVGFDRTNKPQNSEAENWNLVLENAVGISKGPALNVWSAPLAAGANELDLGRYSVIFGFVPQDVKIKPRLIFTTTAPPGEQPNLDWLFEK